MFCSFIDHCLPGFSLPAPRTTLGLLKKPSRGEEPGPPQPWASPGRSAQPGHVGGGRRCFPAQLWGEGAQEAGGSCGFGRDGGFSAGSCHLEAISGAEGAAFPGPHTLAGPAGTQPAASPSRPRGVPRPLPARGHGVARPRGCSEAMPAEWAPACGPGQAVFAHGVSVSPPSSRLSGAFWSPVGTGALPACPDGSVTQPLPVLHRTEVALHPTCLQLEHSPRGLSSGRAVGIRVCPPGGFSPRCSPSFPPLGGANRDSAVLGMQSTNGRSLGDARGCSPPTSNTQPLSQLGQHPVDSGDPAGPGAADTQGDRQQQRAKADAEHQRWFPVAENPHPAHGRGEAQQGEPGLRRWVTQVSVPHLVVSYSACGAMPEKGKVGRWLQGNPRGGAGQGARGGTVTAASPPPRLSRRRPSSSRRRSTSSPWSRRRPGYCSRTPSSSGSSRCCPRRWEGTVLGAGEGTVPAAQHFAAAPRGPS